MNWRNVEGWWATADNALNTHLAAQVQDGAIVTLGVYKGRSMVALAEALAAAGHLADVDLVGIDRFSGSTMSHAGTNLADVPRLRLIRRDTVEAAEMFGDGSLAAVFVDAGHDYETTVATIAAWAPKLRPGGIMCGHDYQPNWPGVVQAVDEAYPSGVLTFGTAWAVQPEG